MPNGKNPGVMPWRSRSAPKVRSHRACRGKDTVQTTNKIPILSAPRDPRVILAAKAEVVSFLKLVARVVKLGRHSGLKIRRR